VSDAKDKTAWPPAGDGWTLIGDSVAIRCGDCREVLPVECEAVVCDPPYGLSFMGKKWDYDVPPVETWEACLRSLKPGGHLLAFAGTRTQHRMAVNIEDAGFEIRDMIAWVYSSGFPKSLNVSKQLDAHAKKEWLDVAKGIDNADQSAIMVAWLEHSKSASGAGLSFAKSATGIGTNTPESDSVPELVALQANPENGDAVALLAEMKSNEAPPKSGEGSSVLSNADGGAKRDHAKSAGSQPPKSDATSTPIGTVLCDVRGWQSESTADSLKAVEALKTWLGRKKSSSAADTNALCAALTDDWKRIILRRSKTFQAADTIQQTAFASAISVTIAESTAASLISFTANTLRSKAIDKAAGAERTEIIGVRHRSVKPYNDESGWNSNNTKGDFQYTAPATPAARQWNGWGTALKPALEPITMARKPLEGTVAENVLAHGTGAINIDGCRVGTEPSPTFPARRNAKIFNVGSGGQDVPTPTGGRWPANLIHDESDEVTALFPETKSPSGTTMRAYGAYKTVGGETNHRPCHDSGMTRNTVNGFGDSGSAARFFYCAKADKADRDDGNNHPTVKPVDLMRYLVTLVCREGGTVLDPFMGSGTTGIACIRTGRKFIGIERDARYFEIAKQRLERESRQGLLPFTYPTSDSETNATE